METLNACLARHERQTSLVERYYGADARDAVIGRLAKAWAQTSNGILPVGWADATYTSNNPAFDAFLLCATTTLPVATDTMDCVENEHIRRLQKELVQWAVDYPILPSHAAVDLPHVGDTTVGPVHGNATEFNDMLVQYDKRVQSMTFHPDPRWLHHLCERARERTPILQAQRMKQGHEHIVAVYLERCGLRLVSCAQRSERLRLNRYSPGSGSSDQSLTYVYDTTSKLWRDVCRSRRAQLLMRTAPPLAPSTPNDTDVDQVEVVPPSTDEDPGFTLRVWFPQAGVVETPVPRDRWPVMDAAENVATQDFIACVWLAVNPDFVPAHARRTGMPAEPELLYHLRRTETDTYT